jgi:hypothetical protein
MTELIIRSINIITNNWSFICDYFKVSDTWLLSWRGNNNFIDPFREISDDDLDDIIYELLADESPYG